MANVTASMENVAKTTLWQSNESSYLKSYIIIYKKNNAKEKALKSQRCCTQSGNAVALLGKMQFSAKFGQIVSCLKPPGLVTPFPPLGNTGFATDVVQTNIFGGSLESP